ncbi:MAG: hypothetical protein IKB34_06875 [Clostridia bacterium]|nr:hypothetical protein [Clostridia bacterium]
MSKVGYNLSNGRARSEARLFFERNTKKTFKPFDEYWASCAHPSNGLLFQSK